jgi:formate-dependent nitrite reductase cytochrome c552 subunit
MITAIVIILLMLFVGIRFSKKYRKIRHQQWHVRDWLKTIKAKLTDNKNKKP